MDGLCLKAGLIGITCSKPSLPPLQRTGLRSFPRKSIISGDRNRSDDPVSLDHKEQSEKKGWVLNILQVRSLWQQEEGKGKDYHIQNKDQRVDNENEECDVCRVYDDDDDDDDEIEFDKHSFSRLLQRVSLAEARLYAQICYLGSLAYSIPQIKTGNLLKHHRLRFVTSSLEKKAQLAAKFDKEKALDGVQAVEEENKKNEQETLNPDKGAISDEFLQDEENKEEKRDGNPINASAAYHIAASAASYLHSHTKSIIPFNFFENDMIETSSEGDTDNVGTTNEKVASLVATTDSVTAVVAAKEEVKQAVADDLNLTDSSPCEWFICDDEQSSTRYFVIQGSESLASWQANLLFEPIQFEELDVLVHRGIYEAAKGIYKLILPEVHGHLQRHGDRAAFRFTGHSLGGSLSLLVSLMLLIRDQIPLSSLLPVITFGSPSVMCGGDRLLAKLSLGRSHLQAITMHRDIVPRAFSCNYPTRVAEILKAVNGNFRNHPCLNNQNLLYAPMGELLILQPDAKFSPNHHLLPAGSGFYLLTSPESNMIEAEKEIGAAQSVFLNTPHPLEILSDRSAYGSEGAIQRDHDVESYLKAIWNVIRREIKRARKARRENRRRVWWPLLALPGNGIMGPGHTGADQGWVKISGVESLERFTTMVVSQHMHLLVIFLVSARLLIVQACNVMGSG